MCLVHDIVEIDAGDTYAYDAEGVKTQRAREEAAADRLFGLLPEDQARQMRDLWEEFEANRTPEAHFAHAMDNFQPLLLNDSNGGGDWAEKGVRRSQVEKRNEKTHLGSEEIWQYVREVLDRNTARGSLRED